MFPDLGALHRQLAAGRAAANAIMVDTCRITKPGTGARVLDPDTLVYTDPAPITVYEGPCRLQIRADVNSNVVEVTAGEKEWAYQTAILAVPVIAPKGAVGDTANVRVDHTVEYLTALEDPGLVGRKFQIRAIHHKTHATSRRFRITEAM